MVVIELDEYHIHQAAKSVHFHGYPQRDLRALYCALPADVFLLPVF
jgi:hypothetical protein